MSPQHIHELWPSRHQSCDQDPGPIATLDEARYILDTHPEHGCLQHAAAMARASSELAA